LYRSRGVYQVERRKGQGTRGHQRTLVYRRLPLVFSLSRSGKSIRVAGATDICDKPRVHIDVHQGAFIIAQHFCLLLLVVHPSEIGDFCFRALSRRETGFFYTHYVHLLWERVPRVQRVNVMCIGEERRSEASRRQGHFTLRSRRRVYMREESFSPLLLCASLCHTVYNDE
jgi:hypothetical protein